MRISDWSSDVCSSDLFAGLEEIISSRSGRRGIGFGAPLRSADADVDVFGEVRPEDLHKFGLIPEFVGRLPVVATVSTLDQSALRSEARRVGKECVSTCRSRWSQYY